MTDCLKEQNIIGPLENRTLASNMTLEGTYTTYLPELPYLSIVYLVTNDRSMENFGRNIWTVPPSPITNLAVRETVSIAGVTQHTFRQTILVPYRVHYPT